LGIGLATVIANSSSPAIVVQKADGVRIGGILFQAGEFNSSSLV